MMKQTATVQANIDFADERDAMRKLRIGMAIGADGERDLRQLVASRRRR